MAGILEKGAEMTEGKGEVGGGGVEGGEGRGD